MLQKSSFGIVLSFCVAVSLYGDVDCYVRQNHTDTLRSFSFSKNDSRLISVAKDNSAKLWDTIQGRELKTVPYIGKDPKQLILIADDTLALVIDDEPFLAIWDMNTLTIKQKIPLSLKARKIFIPSWGDAVFILLDNNELYQFDTKTLTLSSKLTKFTWNITALDCTNDQKLMAIGLENGEIALLDNTYTIIKKVLAHKSSIEKLRFFTDGTLLSMTEEGGKYFTANDMSVIHDIPTIPESTILDASITSQEILLCTTKGLKTFSLKKDIPSKEKIMSQNVNVCKISKNLVALGYENRHIALFDRETLESGVMLSALDTKVLSLHDTEEGRTLITLEKSIRAWDSATLTPLKVIVESNETILTSYYRKDDNTILASFSDGTLKGWDLSDYKEKINVHFDIPLQKIFLSHDKKYLLGITKKGFIVADAQNGTILKTKSFRTRFHSLSLRHNYISALTSSGIINFDFTTLEKKNTNNFLNDGDHVEFTAVSPNGQYIAVGSSKGKMYLFDTESLKNINEWEIKANSGAFSSDNRRIALTTDKGEIKLFDVFSRTEVASFKYKYLMKNLLFSADSRYLLGSTPHGVVTVFRSDLGEKLVDIYNFGKNDWVTISPQGFYKSSSHGDSHIYVVSDKELYSIDYFRQKFYRPMALEEGYQSGSFKDVLARIKNEEVDFNETLISPPYIVIKNSTDESLRVSSLNVELPLFVEERQGVIRQIRILVNGIETTSAKTRALKGIKLTSSLEKSDTMSKETTQSKEGWYPHQKRIDTTLTLDLEPGENVIEIIADNGISQSKKRLTVMADVANEKILPTLWLMAIGVNRYSDTKIPSLDFASLDAKAVIDTMKKQEGKVYKKVNTLLLTSEGTKKPTFETIVDGLSFFDKANDNDIIAFFIAGHGMNDKKGDFYFLPQDAQIENGEIKRSKALSWRTLRSVLELPGRKLFMIDACHSQGVTGKNSAVNNDRIIRDLSLYNAVVLTSSRGNELSQESEKWGHGAFSTALLEALEGKADFNKDGTIGIKELDTYVSTRVETLTGGAQHPLSYTPDGYANFTVAKP